MVPEDIYKRRNLVKMSQRPKFPISSVCRRLVFDDENAPNQEIPRAVEDLQNQADEQIPQHLEEACNDNIQNALVEELRHSREEARKRWNFDFETETPLNGDWEWEKVENDNKNEGDRSNGRVNVQNNNELRD